MDQATIPHDWNLSTTQSSSCSLLVSLFCPTSFSHTPPQVLDIPNHMPSLTNQIYYQNYIQIAILYGSNTLPIKKLSHKEPLSFKFRQNVQYLQYGSCPFIFRALFVQTTTPTFSTKNPFLYFHLAIPPLLVHKFIPTLPS